MNRDFLRCLRAVTSQYQSIHRHCQPLVGQFQPWRSLTVSQTAAALRPIYFVVHPDLFGQYPKEREVNEESLKKLHEYVTSLQKTGKATPTNLFFYVRKHSKLDMNCVNVQLTSRNLKSTVTTILTSFKLPVDFSQNVDETGPLILWNEEYYEYRFRDQTKATEEKKDQVKPTKSLLSWLQKNSRKAHNNEEASRLIQKKIVQLGQNLVADIGLVSMDWVSDWGTNHCMACLRSFSRLHSEHPNRVRAALQGRRLVFSNKTGVSLLGEIVLSSEEVPTDWMTLLSRVEAYDAVLERLPYMEEKLSQLLGHIHVVRKKGKQILMAQDYELLLNKILNSLRRSQDDVDRYFHGSDLSHLQLSVEGESAPLTLSAEGRFLIPASMPGSIVVKFISENKDKAFTILQQTKLSEKMEKVLVEKCIERFELVALLKEDNVTFDQMTNCCERLIDEGIHIESYIQGRKLLITNYYTVSQDGQFCIPWNWRSDFS